MHPSLMRLLLLLAAACLASCASLGGELVSKPEEVPQALVDADALAAEGRLRKALDLLRDARAVQGLNASQAFEVDTRIEQHARTYIQQLARSTDGAAELSRMVEWNLPAQLAVTAGVQAARLRMQQGKRYKAFRVLSKVEQRYPLHHESAAAGAILVEAGLSMADDPWSLLGFFATQDKGVEVLEYVVVKHPSERRCDEAYMKLGSIYQERGQWVLARQRFEDLRLYHPKSPLAVTAEALIPRQRLLNLESPEYDRRDLLKARLELETFLRSYPEGELADAARLDLADCLQRLVLSDLSVARFYRRVREPDGARLHAQRALQNAQVAGDAGLVRTSEELIASLVGMEARARKQELLTPDRPPTPLERELLQEQTP